LGQSCVSYGEEKGVYVRANDIRIVQLLDKLKDNALDFFFSRYGISFQLDTNQHRQLVISVKNEGEIFRRRSWTVCSRE